MPARNNVLYSVAQTELLNLVYNRLTPLCSILLENIAVPTVFQCFIQHPLIRCNAAGGQSLVVSPPVKAEPGAHRTDPTEDGEGTICITQGSQSDGRTRLASDMCSDLLVGFGALSRHGGRHWQI